MAGERFCERYALLLYEYNEAGLRDCHLLNDYLNARDHIWAISTMNGDGFYEAVFSKLEEEKNKKISESKNRVRKAWEETARKLVLKNKEKDLNTQ